MRSSLFFLLIATLGNHRASDDKPSLAALCEESNSLIAKIRDKVIDPEEAVAEFKALVPQLREYYYRSGGKDFSKSQWVFPLQGYDFQSIGRMNGDGYIPSRYNFFDGNRHSGHPAHDIFVFDLNRDCRDDVTKQPVNVLSLTGGVMIAAEKQWEDTSTKRGGNYVWVYDPASKSFLYYAHNNDVLVKPGNVVQPGEVLAAVGRTGLNAARRRSPTHLHIMRVELDSTNYPRPKNLYRDLLKAKVIKNE